MPARKTKSFSRKEVSLPLLLTLGGLGVLTLVYASGFFSLTTASNAGSIQANDRVTVDGVNNTTQYLTSMVLHAPGTNEKVTLNYDPVLNALRIKGAVNADGLIIGNNEASVGNTILGGTNNQATEGTNTNSLIVGGESNKLNNASNSAIIGGQNNTLLNTENVAVIGSSQTTFPVGEKRENIFIVGGTGNQVKGSNVFILGEGQNVAGLDMVLMGKKIKAGDQRQIFVWSDEDQDFFPQRSNAFYVNTTKGIGLNTNDPKVKFDAGQAGGVRIGITASLVNNCSPNYAGVMAYVHVGGKSGFCGCNGQTWVPLTADPSIQAVCINMQKSPCAGSQPLNANKGAEIHLPLWDPNANNGDGAFMPKNWMYTNASPKAECTYDCQIGYHPGQNNPEGKHLDGACKACSSIDRRYTAGAHNGWKTAGKGNDDCDFSCVGGSFYKNTASQRACPLCSTGKSIATLVSKISGNTHYDKAWYSPDDNQWTSCRLCNNKPVNAKYTQKDVNSATGACPWECADGYNKRGNDCLKATWTKKRTRICRNSGKWKDAYDEVTYECRDTSGGLVNDTRICNIWGAKPADRNSNVSDSSCNEPSWTTRECDASNCSGKCNGDTVSVQCRREYRDGYGTVYNRETKSESRQCYGACDNGTCGAAAQPTKTKPTSNLCAAGSRLQGSVSTNSDGWRWTCKGEHGTTSCFAPKQALQAGACNANVNGVNVNWADGSWPSNTTLCSYGTVIEKNFNTNPNVYLNKWSWKCEGDVGASKASCAAHKPNTNAWRCDQNRINSCVKVGNPNPKAGKPVAGFQNGKQWVCENGGTIADVYCTKCNDGYQGTVYDQNQPAQCVKIDQQRDQPCPESKPTGTEYVLGSSTYTQTSSDGGVNWTPTTKSWTYTGSKSPGECEYTCAAGYERKNSQCVKQNTTETQTASCAGTKPSTAANYAFGAGEYTQSRVNNEPWTPNLSWTYVKKSPNDLQACEYTCANNYHRENNACLSNEKEIDCKKEGAPANAEYATIKVKVKWNGTSWNEPSRCEWNCKSGFHKEGNECKSNIQKADCGGSKPATSPSYAFGATKYEKTYQNGVWTPASKDWKYVSSSVGLNACEYSCAAGYILDNNSCVKPQCTGQVPANATLIVGDDKGLTSNTQRKLVSKDTSAKCEYICKSDFHYGWCEDVWAGASLGGSSSQVPCCQKNQCTGPVPANATLIVGDDEGLTSNTQRKVVSKDTSAKCEYICDSGFVFENGACVKPQCTGPVPANATLIAGDDEGLTANTQRQLVSKDTSAKCEYMCDASKGYTLQNGACAQYHYQCMENGAKGFSLAFDKWGHGEINGIHMIMTQNCPCHPNEIKHQKLSIYLVKNGGGQNVFTTEWSRDSGVGGEGGWGPDPDDWIGLERRNGSRELGWTVFDFPVKVKERTGGVGQRSGRIDYAATCDGGKTMETSYTITQHD